MIIGIVGLGVVGSACKFGFEKFGHEVVVHDIKMDTKINNVFCADIVYICVPTPTGLDGKCDTTIVENVVDELAYVGYHGVIAIKSTVAPGTTKRLKEKHPALNLCFVPEFLTAVSAMKREKVSQPKITFS